MLGIGTALQAQRELATNNCFTMDMISVTPDEDNTKVIYDFVIDNNSSLAMNVYDDRSIYHQTCPGQTVCFFTWEYNKPECVDINMEIICAPNLRDPSCWRDGCVVIIDARGLACDTNPN